MSKYPGHHTANHPRGAFPQYPSGSGPGGPGSGGPMNIMSGQGPPVPGRMGFAQGRNSMPQNLGYNTGAGGYPGGYPPTSGLPYNSMGGNNMGMGNNSNNLSASNTNSQMNYGHASQHNTPAHSPYSSSPSSSYPNASKSHSSAPLRRYILLPPPKKRKLHKTSDLGFPGVFPQRPGQDEDQMTPSNVKTGYMDKGIIQNETVSAQGILADGLMDPKKLQDLGAFMVEVLKKRQESSRITGPSTFRPPSRATLNDQKKEQWMTDLSGTTSLRRLSKSVPHGFKSEKLLEALAQRQVPMLRATWYIKIVALSEMQAQRSRPSTSQHQYSTDWTMIVNMFLKKQLMEINPHSTTKPVASALNPAGGAQNVKPWASEEAKEKWEAKWRYSVMLTKWQYNEGLLDHRHFLRATVEQLSALGFEQVALLLSLISMFLSEYARSRLLMRLLIEGLLNTLQLVQSHPSYNQTLFRYSYLELELKRMLQSIFLSTPDMFVIPKAWATHSALLHQVLLKDIQSSPDKPAVFPNVGSVLESHYKMIQARVRVFTDLTVPATEADSTGTRSTYNVEILDKVDHLSDLEQVAHEYFADDRDDYPTTASIPPSPSKPAFDPSVTTPSSSITTTDSRFHQQPPSSPLSSTATSPHSPSSTQRQDAIWKSRVNTLCEWAITNSRYGHHRVYLVGTLLNIWRDSPTLSVHIKPEERALRLQATLLEFLDSFNGSHPHSAHVQDSTLGLHQPHLSHHHHHGSEDTLDAMARLFGNLIHDRLFSYQQYLQRLIARGDLQLSRRGQESTLRHLKYLQSFPLHKGALPHHLNQRRVVLFGVNGEDEYDQECFETITAQIKAKLPYMFSSDAANMTVPINDSSQDHQELGQPLHVQLTELILSASRFCQLRVTSQWLLDAVQSYVVKHIQIGEDNWRVMTSPGSSLLNARQFATVVNVMEVASDFHSLYDMCIWLLDHTVNKTLLTYVVNVAKKHYMVWAAMGILTKFSQAILSKHYNLQGKNMLFKALPRYLAYEAHNVPEDIRAQMVSDLVITKTATATGATIPTQLPELQQLLTDPSPNAVSNMASSLHFKYGGLSHWPLRLFDSCIDTLQKMDARHRSTSANNMMVQLSSPATMHEIVRASKLFVGLLVEMAEKIGTGCMDDVVLAWLRLHDADWTKHNIFGPPGSTFTSISGSAAMTVQGNDMQECDDEYQPIWFLSFMVQLVIQGFCSIDVLVQNFCGTLLTKVAQSIQPQDPNGDDSNLHHQQPKIPDETMMSLCRTMVRLLRLLLLEDASSNPRVSQAYGTSNHTLMTNQHPHQAALRLTIAEIHALQTQRNSGLATSQQTPKNQDPDDHAGTSLLTTSQEHRMMLMQFKICRDLVWIESCLPLNHKVLHEIQEYRKDWAMSADWLREKCLADVDAAYKVFLQTKQEQQQQQQQQAESSDGTRANAATITNNSSTDSKSSKKHMEMVDKKMMETFQMLVAENHESLLLLDTMYGDASMLTPSMVHQRTLRSIFSRVDRWIFDRCKVEFWLLLDNVMMERTIVSGMVPLDADGAPRSKHAGDGDGRGVVKNNDDASLSSASSGTGGSSDGLLMMEGVTMTSGSTVASQLPDNGMDISNGPSLGSDGHYHHHGHGDSLQLLIHIFFQEFVLSETADKELLGRMLIGMRSDAVEEFIQYGYSILAGNSNSSFPYNVMIVQRPVNSVDYIKIVANFHYVMEILMKESQPAIPLSMTRDEGNGQSATGAAATPLASTPSNSQSTASSANNIKPAAAALKGLDATQLENRIRFAKSLLWQLKRFEERIRFFDVMHAVGCSFEDAVKVVQENETGTGEFGDLLLTTAAAPSSQQQYYNHSPFTSAAHSHLTSSAVYLIDLRTSLCLCLRLLVPLMPVILQYPSASSCDLATYVIRLTNLLVSSIIHGHGSEERLFEFCLDMASCLMDEVLLLSGGGAADSKAMRNDILNQLRTGLPQMTTSIPTVFASRIFRILPFQQHNVYFTNLRASGDVGNNALTRTATPHREILPRPWDWLEDCVGDVDQNPNQQLYQQHLTAQSPALGQGLYDAGTPSSGLSNGDGSPGVGGSGTVAGSSSSSSLHISGSSLLSSASNENLNDTSISLTFFGAKQVRKSTDGTTYETQFKLGHGGGDDEQELLMVEEQQRPCEYNHSHQQQLLILQHQQRHQEQQLQQESQMDNNGASHLQGVNQINFDIFGHPASNPAGGVRTGSVPPLPRQQEPDPELEEGQILNDEDLDMNTMSWETSNNIINTLQLPVTTSASAKAMETTTATIRGIEEGEVIEVNGDDGNSIKSIPISGLSTSIGTAFTATTSVSGPTLPTTTTTITAAPTTVTGKKRSNAGSTKTAKTATSSTTPMATTSAAATTKAARTSKGSRSGKGSKATQAVAPTVASFTSSEGMVASTSAPNDAASTNTTASNTQQPQQFQPFSSQAFSGTQARQPMLIALPPHSQQQQQQQGGVPSSHQLMNIMRQSQNAAAAAMAVTSASSSAPATTTIGGIHVPALNGQQQQQNQYMDPSAFLKNNNGNNNNNNNNNNGNGQQGGFGVGNPLNINLGHLNHGNNQGGFF